MRVSPQNPKASVLPSGVSLAGLLSFYSPGAWEEFILEWMQGFQPACFKSERFGGAGDLGRDVVGYVTSPIATSAWDNYQCKHYAKPLQPSDIWVELGKLCYHSWKGAFKPPRKYRFVAPNEVSPSLKDLLRKPDQLREVLKEKWQKYCEFTRNEAVGRYGFFPVR